MDLSSFANSLQSWLSQIPPVAIGLALLAGPTLVLIVYRFVSLARRVPVSGEVEAPPLWVCFTCRSVNELRMSSCYRCGGERDAAGKIEILVDRPESPTRWFDVPAGSPFAAVADVQQRKGIPVMGPAPAQANATNRDPIAVGPGRDVELAPVPAEVGSSDLIEADR